MASLHFNCVQMYLCVCLILSLSSYYCLPVKSKGHQSSHINNSSKDKKGTIRIAGPWHSDSALDRNVDVGEDAYVKKIISSNEGINFNKDIAEAGEMFDVNGIEDFYDKNAMITYEINGHEIPVHMHPKLTPQSKSLFPEYVKDSPASIGLSRGASKHRIAPSLSTLGNFKKNPDAREMSMFAGASINDMPEYKTGSPIQVAKVDGGKVGMSTSQTFTKSIHSQNKVPESPQNSAEPYKSLAATNGKLSLRMVQPMLHEPSANLREFRNPVPLESIDNQQVKQDLPAVSDNNIHEENIQGSAPNNGIESIQPGHDASAVQNYANHEVRLEGESSDFNGQKYEVPATNSVQENLFPPHDVSSEKKTKTEDVLFQKLENLHRNLEKDKLVNEADMKSLAEGSDVDPNKTKAKARILNLLGALTDKLKGMESIVSGNRDKQVEKFISNKNLNDGELISGVNQVNAEQSLNHEASDEQDHQNELVAQRENSLYSSHEPSVKEDLESPSSDEASMLASQIQMKAENVGKLLREGNTGEDVREESPHYGLGESSYPHNGEESARERDRQGHEDDGRAMLMKTFRKISDTSNDDYLTHHNTAEENKYESEIIQKFKEHNKPFVMNTNAIDFKPSQMSDTDSNDIENDENIHLHNSRDDNDEDEENQRKQTSHLRENNDEDSVYADSRQTLSHTRRHSTTSDDSSFVDDKKSEDESEEDDEQEKRHRHGHKRHHRRRHHYHDEDGDDEDDDETRKHHRKRHHHLKKNNKNEEDDNDDEDTVKDISGKKLKHEKKEVELEGEENPKISAVEEDLASADEKRDKSYGKDDVVEFPDYNDVKDAAIFETNLLRKQFHAKPIHWSDKLSDRAQLNAENLAKLLDLNEKSVISHKLPGEDVALVNINSTNVGKDAPDLWARGSKFYDFRSPQITAKNIDFAQMMWKSGNEFGLGVAKAKSGNNWIVTSMFDTPVIDRFKDLKMNLESDIPIEDPYSDIVGR